MTAVTIGTDLDACQRLLGDAQQIGDDGTLWSRAELLEHYNDAYRTLLTRSQAVRRWVILEVPGRCTYGITAEWEARHANGGSTWKWTWSAPGYECTSLWEVQQLEGVTPEGGSVGVTQQWERAHSNPTHTPYRFALPRDNERIAGIWYDHRRLGAVETRELDELETHWMSMGDYPLAWTQGTGRSRTFEVFEIVTAHSQGYSLRGGPYGIPRRFSGTRTYTTEGSNLYGVPRRIMSPDRQYLATQGTLGVPRDYHTSPGSLLILEVVGPEVPDLTEQDTPALIPRQMQKYLRYGVLAQAWTRQGEGQQPALAALAEQMFQRGIRVLRELSWITRKDETMQRVPTGAQTNRRPPRVRLPSTYQRVW